MFGYLRTFAVVENIKTSQSTCGSQPLCTCDPINLTTIISDLVLQGICCVICIQTPLPLTHKSKNSNVLSRFFFFEIPC